MSTIQHTLTRGHRYGGKGNHLFYVDQPGAMVQHYLSDEEWQMLGSPDQITLTVEGPPNGSDDALLRVRAIAECVRDDRVRNALLAALATPTTTERSEG